MYEPANIARAVLVGAAVTATLVLAVHAQQTDMTPTPYVVTSPTPTYADLRPTLRPSTTPYPTIR